MSNVKTIKFNHVCCDSGGCHVNNIPVIVSTTGCTWHRLVGQMDMLEEDLIMLTGMHSTIHSAVLQLSNSYCFDYKIGYNTGWLATQVSH